MHWHRVPLMIGTGRKSQTPQPLGYATIGDLTLSQLLILNTTPLDTDG
jgi:multidrug efflux pump subunit AcrB